MEELWVWEITLKVQELKSRLVQLQETIGVMQEVIAEGIATS